MAYFNILWTSSGYTGAPGYTKFHFLADPTAPPNASSVNAAAANSRALLAASVASMPTGVKYHCESPAQWFDDNGTLKGEVAVSSPPVDVVGTGGTTWPGGTGGVIYWVTGVLNGGHKIRGRTYFVPLATGAFASDGTLSTSFVNSMTTAAAAYIASSPQPVVNSRKLGQTDRDDTTVPILAASVKDRSAFLRTRRT